MKICECGGPNVWGYPFSLLIHLHGDRFSLYDPEQLPDLFTYLDVPPLDNQTGCRTIYHRTPDLCPNGDVARHLQETTLTHPLMVLSPENSDVRLDPRP